MASRRLRICALAGALLFASGCGGGGDDEDVQSAVRDFAAAVNEGDYERACDGVTASAQEALEEAAAAAASGCPAVLEQADEAGLLDAVPEDPDEIEFERVEIDGDTARVQIEGDSDVTEMAREDGEWKLSVDR